MSIDNLNRNIKELERLLSQSDTSLKRLQTVISTKEQELHQITIRFDDMKRKYDRVNGEKEGESKKVQAEQFEYSKLLTEYRNLERRISEYDRTFKDMSAEFDRHHSQINNLRQERTVNIEKVFLFSYVESSSSC